MAIFHILFADSDINPHLPPLKVRDLRLDLAKPANLWMDTI